MIPHQTVNPLIIRNCISRLKFDYDLLVSVFSEGTFYFIEQKDVVGVSEKLEISF
jgi:hypothetical protein